MRSNVRIYRSVKREQTCRENEELENAHTKKVNEREHDIKETTGERI